MIGVVLYVTKFLSDVLNNHLTMYNFFGGKPSGFSCFIFVLGLLSQIINERWSCLCMKILSFIFYPRLLNDPIIDPKNF